MNAQQAVMIGMIAFMQIFTIQRTVTRPATSEESTVEIGGLINIGLIICIEKVKKVVSLKIATK